MRQKGIKKTKKAIFLQTPLCKKAVFRKKFSRVRNIFRIVNKYYITKFADCAILSNRRNIPFYF